jgi:phospholipase/carboxylesterase
VTAAAHDMPDEISRREGSVDAAASPDLAALLSPLLRCLETLAFIARNLHPPDFAAMMQAAGTPDEALRAARAQMEHWPEILTEMRGPLAAASDAALAAFEGLHTAPDQDNGLLAAFRALRHVARAQEALYRLARVLPVISAFFLDPARRDDAELLAALADPRPGTGVSHHDNEPGSRGGFSLYVPECAVEDHARPLVMALHGGSGNGRAFLWSWLREARSHGAILIAPTAKGQTWALTGPDVDTPNLMRVLEFVRDRWNVDPTRLLLTGMSDGGTFCYVSALTPTSPFTHLAPVAAAFHPLFAQMADRDRMQDLPIHLVHGALDWMFPVEMARRAQRALAAAGARVTYREIDDLSHTYPREVNAELLTWMGDGPASATP